MSGYPGGNYQPNQHLQHHSSSASGNYGGSYGGYAPPQGPPPVRYNSGGYGDDSRGYAPAQMQATPPGAYLEGSSGYRPNMAHAGSYGPPPGPPPPSGYGPPPGGMSSNPYSDIGHVNYQPSGPQQGEMFYQYSNCTGKRKGLLCGINYVGTRNELRGCQNDTRNLLRFITTNYGFKEEDCVVLLDAPSSNPRQIPTRANMIAAMQWLVADAQPNDSLFFHYSGHGGQVRDQDGDEEDGMDDCIYPVDFEQAGPIIDDEMHDIMVRSLPPGCRLLAIYDSCHSGTALDLPYIYSTEGKIKEPNMLKDGGMAAMTAVGDYMRGDLIDAASSLFSFGKKAFSGSAPRQKTIQTKTSPADVISFSGCKDNQTSADTQEAGQATGAMSWALISALSKYRNLTYIQLLNAVRDELRGKYSQKRAQNLQNRASLLFKNLRTAQLSASHPIDTNLLFIILTKGALMAHSDDTSLLPSIIGCLLALCVNSFVAGAFSQKYLFNVPLVPHLSRDHQIWRLLAHHLAFANSTELFLGALIIWNLAVHIERSFGSVKFASFLGVSALLTTALESICLLALYRLGFKTIPAGPFGIIFSLVYQYQRIVPSSYQFKISSLILNNKVFSYMLAAQLFMSQPFASAVPCLCGLLAGALYRADVVGLRSYRIPSPIVRLANKALNPILGSASMQRPPRRGIHASIADVAPPEGLTSAFSTVGATQATVRRVNGMGASNGPARRPALEEWADALRGPANARPPPTPTAEAVANMQSMFPDATRDQVMQALQASGNDVSRAVERLLTTS